MGGVSGELESRHRGLIRPPRSRAHAETGSEPVFRVFQGHFGEATGLGSPLTHDLRSPRGMGRAKTGDAAERAARHRRSDEVLVAPAIRGRGGHEAEELARAERESVVPGGARGGVPNGSYRER